MSYVDALLCKYQFILVCSEIKMYKLALLVTLV